MSLMRFATICDYPGCAERSDEYTSFPHCLECMKDFCKKHIDIIRQADLNISEAGICENCVGFKIEAENG